MKKPQRISLPPGEVKRFSIAITKEAHRRLREASEQYRLGQDHILSVLLEHVNFESFAPAFRAFVAQHGSKPKTPLSAEKVKEFFASLTPEERQEVLAEINASFREAL